MMTDRNASLFFLLVYAKKGTTSKTAKVNPSTTSVPTKPARWNWPSALFSVNAKVALWLNEHTDKIFLVISCFDISSI